MSGPPPNEPDLAAPPPELAPPAELAAPPPMDRPWVTRVLAAANIVVWIVTVALGASIISPSPEWLIDHGGNLGAITLEGEEWRLFTSMFLHIGVLHLAMNMIGLLAGGRIIERMFGHLGFAAIYLIAGLAGSLATALRPGVVSAGASGAIFGVLGALGAYYVVHRGRMDLRSTRDATGLLVVVGYNVVFGFTQSDIDMYAHLGGLAAGFLCGLALEVGRGEPSGEEASRRRGPRTAAVAVLGLAAVIGGAFAAPAPVDKDRAAIEAFAAVEAKALARWNELVDQIQAEAVTEDQVADAIEQDILSPWRAARDAFEQSGAGGPLREPMLEYIRLRQEGWRMIAEGMRAKDAELVQRGQARLQEAEAAAGKLLQ